MQFPEAPSKICTELLPMPCRHSVQTVSALKHGAIECNTEANRFSNLRALSYFLFVARGPPVTLSRHVGSISAPGLCKRVSWNRILASGSEHYGRDIGLVGLIGLLWVDLTDWIDWIDWRDWSDWIDWSLNWITLG